MDKGSILERYLTRSVLKHIQRQKNIGSMTDGKYYSDAFSHTEEKVTGAVGNDYASFFDVASADGCGDNPMLAWVKAINNISCSGAICHSARIVMLLPASVKESHIKEYMEVFHTQAKEHNVQIVGGQTQIVEAAITAQFIVTMLGKPNKRPAGKKGIREGLDIIMAGDTGLYGTNVMLASKWDTLATRFAGSYLKEAAVDESLYCVAKAARVLFACTSPEELFYVHDVSTGGIYRALWQLGTWTSKGFLIDHYKILIRQETIELAEYFNINPYMIDGTGALLAIVQDGDAAVKQLLKHGIKASVIGSITENKEKIINCPGGSRRCMVPASEDELYKIR